MSWNSEFLKYIDGPKEILYRILAIGRHRSSARFVSGHERIADNQDGHSPAGSGQTTKFCSQCLYTLGNIPAMKAVRLRDDLELNSYSCAHCGRVIDEKHS